MRNPASATDLAALASQRDNVIVVKLDVTLEANAQEAAKMVKERAGKVDVLIPCAGSPSFYLPGVLDRGRADPQSEPQASATLATCATKT